MVTKSLDYIEVKPASERQSLLIMLHGYGSNRDDLMSLAPDIQSNLQGLHIISVNAPHPFELSPESYAFQWFSLESREELAMYSGIKQVSSTLVEFIQERIEALEVLPQKTILFGFSQGSMMSLHTAFHIPLGGIMAYSGMLINPEERIMPYKPKVLLVHGQEDQVVSAEASINCYNQFKAWNVPVELELRPKLAHGIDSTGLIKGISFIRDIIHG